VRVWLRPSLKWTLILALGFGLVALEPASAFPSPIVALGFGLVALEPASGFPSPIDVRGTVDVTATARAR